MWLILPLLGCAPTSTTVGASDLTARFSDLTLSVASEVVVSGDLDGDGQPDLAVLGAGVLQVFSGVPYADPETPTATVEAPGATSLALYPHADGLDLITGGVRLDRWRFDDALELLWTSELATGDALAVGDLDGDGLTDLAATAARGVVRFSGPDLTLLGVFEGSGSLGSALAAGDTDGDGVDELLVGAPAESTRGSGAGAAYLVTGDTILWSVHGQGPGAGLGTAVAMLDGDGDGLDDLFVGSPGHHLDHLVPRRGVVQGWYGPELDPSPSWTGRLSLPTLRASVRELGTALSIGDVTGDGRPDLLVTDGSGRAFVWARSPLGLTPWPSAWHTGAPSATVLDDVSGDGIADWAHHGADGIEIYFGGPLWLDPDGDGFSNPMDCHANDPSRHPGARERCDVIDSDCDGDLVDEEPDADDDGLPDCIDPDAWADFDWSIMLPGSLGRAVAMGDLDGDGTQDGVLLAPDLDFVFPGQGAAYVFRSTSSLPTDALFGTDVDSGLNDVAVGDVDADGFADILLVTEESLRIHRGAPDGPSPVATWTFPTGGSRVTTAPPDAGGLSDFAVARSDATYLYQASAGPRLVAKLRGATDVLLADVDGDASLDIILGGSPVTVVFGPTYTELHDLPAAGDVLTALDADTDGLADVVIGELDTTLWSLARRVPRRLETLASAPTALGSADLNQDGWPDLFVGETERVAVHVGTPEGPAVTPLHWDGPVESVGFGAALAATDQSLVVGAPEHERGGSVYRWDSTLDLDADGLTDTLEWALGLSPADPDMDDDGRLDGDELVLGALVDTDGDGLVDPLDTDSDGDGVSDGEDVCPLVADDQTDTDGDGYGDACDCPEVDEEAVRSLASVTDQALDAGADDASSGIYKRGRALVVADFDLDGRPDQYIGNPGDPSLVLRNVTETHGAPRFEVAQELMVGHYAWTAAAADYDNDGDYDLVVGGGGNECVDFDILWRNEWMETGELRFTDVTAEAGIAGPDLGAGPVARATASVNWVDVDRDGDVDLFVGANWSVLCTRLDLEDARNTLWQNNGDGTFTDITEAVGLHTSLGGTRHATFADLDGDGDDDLYEPNMLTANVLWQNQLSETGELRFVDVTAYTEGADLSRPTEAFASCAGDMDNDGWEDLVVFRREDADCALPFVPYDDADGHAVFRNLAGEAFENVGMRSRLNDHPVDRQRRLGVMGCQLGDLDGDGFLDVFIGNGGPIGGQYNQLLLADTTWGDAIAFQDVSLLIDFPADPSPEVDHIPSYPYRTHGTAILDADGDLVPELWVSNGGPASEPDTVREPNRLFSFDWAHEARFLTVRPVGDGVHVPRDGIGTRLHLVTIGPDGSERSIWRHQSGGSCFSAQSGFEVPFGLGEAVSVDRLEVYWPDGTARVYRSGLAAGERVVVEY